MLSIFVFSGSQQSRAKLSCYERLWNRAGHRQTSNDPGPRPAMYSGGVGNSVVSDQPINETMYGIFSERWNTTH